MDVARNHVLSDADAVECIVLEFRDDGNLPSGLLFFRMIPHAYDTISFNDMVRLCIGLDRNRVGVWNELALPISCKSPMVERALKILTNHLTACQICTKMWAKSVDGVRKIRRRACAKHSYVSPKTEEPLHFSRLQLR